MKISGTLLLAPDFFKTMQITRLLLIMPNRQIVPKGEHDEAAIAHPAGVTCRDKCRQESQLCQNHR